jgi:hypothetical protein
MLFGLACLTFIIAAIIAILGVHGVTMMTVIGIIAIGLALAALGLAIGRDPWWPGSWRRGRPVR